MKTDIKVDNENETSEADQDSVESEKNKEAENYHVVKNTILTAADKSQIKIIKNQDCKSWTYLKGNLL